MVVEHSADESSQQQGVQSYAEHPSGHPAGPGGQLLEQGGAATWRTSTSGIMTIMNRK